MYKSEKNVFWQSLVVTLAIFLIGIFLGLVLENWRYNNIEQLAKESEIDLIDIKLQSEIYSEDNFNCESAIRENINFAERIFEEANLLKKYEDASRLKEDIKIQHKKYDILRAMLLINSKRIKEKCNANYHDVVYFYQFNEPSIETKAKQRTFSNVLIDLKNEFGSEILLIPMAGDNDIISIKLILETYGISEEDLPIIVIDEKIKITEVTNVNDLKLVLEKKQDNIIKL
ncbi:MAG: hypothetical protein ABIH37_04430 [archaeon]